MRGFKMLSQEKCALINFGETGTLINAGTCWRFFNNNEHDRDFSDLENVMITAIFEAGVEHQKSTVSRVRK
jgi:hypothetical protein